MGVRKGQKKGLWGWRRKIQKKLFFFPQIFDEWMECGCLGNTAGLWSVDWRAVTDSWDQMMWCIQEAKQVCGGRKSIHAKAKAASSLPFVQWNANTMTSPASCVSCWWWLHKCCHSITPITTLLLPQLFQPHEPNNSLGYWLGYGLDVPPFRPRKVQLIFLLSKSCGLSLEPTRPPTKGRFSYSMPRPCPSPAMPCR